VPPSQRDPALDLRSTAARYPFAPRRIEAASAIAHDRAARRGDARVTAADLDEVCCALPDPRLGGLAERLPLPYGRDDLIVPAETRRELDLAEAWSRGGRIDLDEWGLADRSAAGHGLACLFHGPSGTGKTMGAQVLAARVGLELYRIDLSQVVDKYVGETEKNLSRVFDEAREANVVLFFDEADALFGKRTQVKDAHDRYANVETGFLLQRLEQHDGITILATNLRQNLDDAFLRRLHVIAEFPLPGADERIRIWQRRLPAAPHRSTDIDVELLARRFEMSGAQIRNAVTAAALLASTEGCRVGMSQLVRGVWRELRKSGRIIDAQSFGPWRGEIDRYAAR
jgi:hypothetical protein